MMIRAKFLIFGLAFVAMFSGAATLAQNKNTAEIPSPDITEAIEACRPRLPEEGPWTCDPRVLNEAKCQTKPILGLSKDWDGIGSASAAKRMLRNKYHELGNAIAMVRWIKCQELSFEESKYWKYKSDCVCEKSILMSAAFSRTNINPYPLPWRRFDSRGTQISESINFLFDDFGQINQISFERIF